MGCISLLYLLKLCIFFKHAHPNNKSFLNKEIETYKQMAIGIGSTTSSFAKCFVDIL